MAKIRILCSQCNHEARVPETFRGKKVRCLRCHAKLRIPEDAPYEEPKGGKTRDDKPAMAPVDNTPTTRAPRRGRNEDSGHRRRAAGEPEATRGGPSSKTRREAMSVLRELLHEYDHAIESVPRGFEIDLRGVALGLARTLVEEMLSCPAIRDVKLSGGTGECRIVVSLQGYKFDPEDSFADDDEDTEVFQRGGRAVGGLLGPAVGLDGDDDDDDPARHLEREGPDVPPESAMQSIFAPGEVTTRSRGMDPMKLFEQARTAIDEGEPAQAIPLLEKAIKLDKNFAKAVHALGRAYASTGDYQRARRAFRHLTTLDKDDPEAHVLYAAAAVRCERYDDAKGALKAAIQLDPEYQQAYRYAAQLYEKLGDDEKARVFRARYQALKLKG